MKKSTIFMVSLVFLMVSCDRRNYYHTDSYESIEGGCIKFKDVCTCDETEVGIDTKICGSYTIQENK
jgi:hypothetical protein